MFEIIANGYDPRKLGFNYNDDIFKNVEKEFNDKKKEYILFEEDDKTKTNIRIKINTSSDSILIENADKKLQKYFNNLFENKKCADYILLTENNSGKYDVHIFELCKTFNNKKANLEKQLEGAFLRIECILRYYTNIEADNYVFYCVTENYDTTPSDYRFYDKGNKISKFPKE